MYQVEVVEAFQFPLYLRMQKRPEATRFCKELSRVWYEAVFSLEDDLGKKEERRNSWEHVFPFIPKDPTLQTNII